MSRRLGLVLLVFGLSVSGCASNAVSAPPRKPDVEVSVGDERPSDAELQAKWWTWAASSPEGTNPVVDATGEFCATNQSRSGAWLVAGTFGDKVRRECEVPSGRPVAGPAVNKLESDTAGCADFMSDAKGTVLLDGVAQEIIRIDDSEFTFKATRGNPVVGSAGEFETHGCGLWVWIPPLSAGEHELVIKGSSGAFSTEANYRLVVGSAA